MPEAMSPAVQAVPAAATPENCKSFLETSR